MLSSPRGNPRHEEGNFLFSHKMVEMGSPGVESRLLCFFAEIDVGWGGNRIQGGQQRGLNSVVVEGREIRWGEVNA